MAIKKAVAVIERNMKLLSPRNCNDQVAFSRG